MAVEREALRDWHRLFGLLLTDFFTGSSFRVEVERDLSVQQQLLDVTIVHRGGAQGGRLPGQFYENLGGGGFAVSFTREDSNRQYAKEHFPQLTPQEQREALELLSPEQRREVLQALPPEDRREVLRSLPPEE